MQVTPLLLLHFDGQTVENTGFCETNIELLGHKFFSDCLLATFALAASIYSASTGQKSRNFCRDMSMLSMIISCTIYIAYYELETLFQWPPAEAAPVALKENIQAITQFCQNNLENLFIPCVIVYAINVIFGIWISAKTELDASHIQIGEGSPAVASVDRGGTGNAE